MKDGDLDSDTKNLDDVEVEDSFSKQAMSAVISPVSDDLLRKEHERARS